MKVIRIESTPEQIEEAIFEGPTIDPCRYLYAIEVCPDLNAGDHWEQRVPVHAVILALRRDADHYGELLQDERTRRREAEAALADLTDALRKIYKAATT